MEALCSNVMGLGGRAFQRLLGSDEVMRAVPCDAISALTRRARDASFSLQHVRTQREGSQQQVRKQAPHQELSLPASDLGLPASRIVGNKCLLCKSPRLWYFVIAKYH